MRSRKLKIAGDKVANPRRDTLPIVSSKCAFGKFWQCRERVESFKIQTKSKEFGGRAGSFVDQRHQKQHRDATLDRTSSKFVEVASRLCCVVSGLENLGLYQRVRDDR